MSKNKETYSGLAADSYSMERELRFSRAVFNIASCFVKTENLDKIINMALRELGVACGADRAYLFLFRNDTELMDNTHEWCREGVKPEMENLQAFPFTAVPWYINELRSGKLINIENVEKLPEAASLEKDVLRSQNIKSLLGLPVLFQGVLKGFVGLDNTSEDHPWQNKSDKILGVASEIISSAILRDEDRKQLIKKNHKLENAYDEINKTQVKLVHSEKLAGIGQLAAGIAHEINNPVGFVSSNSTVLKKYIDKMISIINTYRSRKGREIIAAEEKKMKIDHILDDVRGLVDENIDGLSRIAEIVNNLKNFARIDQTEEMEATNINDGIKSALLVARNELKYCAEVETDFGDIPEVMCHASEINQVFLNILVNAAHAIKSMSLEQKGLIEVRTYRDGDYVCCSIRDSGSGIPHDIRDKIYNPFFTTKPPGKGTGLGLNISYDIIINKHQGEINLNTEENNGTEFIVMLPINRDFNENIV